MNKKILSTLESSPILTHEEGEEILDALRKQKKINIQFQKKRIHDLDLWKVEQS